MEVITLNFVTLLGYTTISWFGGWFVVKMSLQLVSNLSNEIETLFNEQNQPLFKRAELGKYLGIINIRDNFNELSSHYACPQSEIEGVSVTDTLGKAKNSHDIFINLDSAIEIAVRSKKPKAVALVKWLTKKCVEKYSKNIKKPSQAVTVKSKPLSSIMRNINETF